MTRKKAVVLEEPTLEAVPPASATDLATATYYGISVEEAKRADTIYGYGNNTGDTVAQALGLDREECDVTWPTTHMPDIVGMTTTNADAAITAARLVKGTTAPVRGTLNIVQASTPAKNTILRDGTSVGYTFGDGT